MDLRNLPPELPANERIAERRKRIECTLGTELAHLHMSDDQVGEADTKNCEQMFGAVPIPVGYAGPLSVTFSSGTVNDIHLPLATTEGALVASVNRGCKALQDAGGVHTHSVHHGISRTIVFQSPNPEFLATSIDERRDEWKAVGESTSDHLRITKHTIDISGSYVFVTVFADTDEAMGMNMITIAAAEIGQWIAAQLDRPFITVAGNVDSDKKPSKRTQEKGRGYEVIAEALVPSSVIEHTLKAQVDRMVYTAIAKLEHGSRIAGALSSNLHIANTVAALYLATGQDAAHVTEGSLGTTLIEKEGSDLRIRVRLPAVIVGVRGGGTSLPAQKQCLDLLLREEARLHPCAQLAESIGAAVLAGELSLLAAQATHTLASSHKKMAR